MDDVLRNTTIPKSIKLRHIDFISEGIGITVDGKDRIGSKFGALLTVITYGVFIWTLYYFISGFLDTSSPKIQFNISSEKNGNNFQLSETDTYFFFLAQNPEVGLDSEFMMKRFSSQPNDIP